MSSGKNQKKKQNKKQNKQKQKQKQEQKTATQKEILLKHPNRNTKVIFADCKEEEGYQK